MDYEKDTWMQWEDEIVACCMDNCWIVCRVIHTPFCKNSKTTGWLTILNKSKLKWEVQQKQYFVDCYCCVSVVWLKAIGYLLPYSHIKLRPCPMSKSSKSLHCLVTLLSAEHRIDNSIIICTLYTKNISVTATISKVSPWSRVQTPPRAHELRLHARVTQWSEWGSYEGSLIFANFPLGGER